MRKRWIWDWTIISHYRFFRVRSCGLGYRSPIYSSVEWTRFEYRRRTFAFRWNVDFEENNSPSIGPGSELRSITNRFYDSSRLLISCSALAHAYIIWYTSCCHVREAYNTDHDDLNLCLRFQSQNVMMLLTLGPHLRIMVKVADCGSSTACRVRKTALVPVLWTLRS